MTLVVEKKMMRHISPLGCALIALVSCDSGKSTSNSAEEARENPPTEMVSTQRTSDGLDEAITECEGHLAKLNEINETLRNGDSDRSSEVVSAYLTDLDEWFKERLVTRAKLNARGGMFEEADRLDVQTVDSLASFYSEARTLLGADHLAALDAVDAALRKYGYHRRVLQKLSNAGGKGD